MPIGKRVRHNDGLIKTVLWIKQMRILLTGVAGFIGAAVAQRLLTEGVQVLGVDNLNDYYDVRLKQARLATLKNQPGFRFAKIDITAADEVFALLAGERFDAVIHLAAQAGVRHSIDHPQDYFSNNLTGFGLILEACRQQKIGHLIYASSSSVYGASVQQPFCERSDPVGQPLSLYAASKRANELMAHSYSALYGLPTTGLRFFTVYGPWGRPDMAPFIFTKRILEGQTIDVYNHGHHSRDFTYIDDIADGVVKVLSQTAQPEPNWYETGTDLDRSFAPFRLFNIASGKPVALGRFIELIEQACGKSARLNYLPKQPGDVEATWADTTALQEAVGYAPKMDIETGVKRLVDWYRDYYRV